MITLDIVSTGIWSPLCANWQAFSDGINACSWDFDAVLKPGMIPPRERRRAPQSVKMAVEVLDQACTAAALDPATAAVVFSSAMGDMQITDYMCRVLSASPRLVSPIRFHNSVHNATTGYWSIASHAHTATNAVSAFEYTAPMAFMEAACQASEDGMPVLLVTQEMAAPRTLHAICPSDQPFSLAFLLAKPRRCENPLAKVAFSVETKTAEWPEFPGDLKLAFADNFGAGLLPLAATIAASRFKEATQPADIEFPVSQGSCLRLSVSAPAYSSQIT